MKLSIAKSATHVTLTWSIPLNEDPNILVQRADGQGVPALQGAMYKLDGEHDIGDPNGVPQLAQLTFGRPGAQPVKVREPSTVLGWYIPKPDQTIVEKSRRLKLIGNMATRIYSTIRKRTDPVAWAQTERAKLQQHLDAGIGPLTLSYTPPVDPNESSWGWRDLSDFDVAKMIDGATPKDGGKTRVWLINEVNDGTRWPDKNYQSAVVRASGIARQLIKLGWKRDQLGAPSLTTPTETDAKAMIAAIELVDPLNDLFDWVVLDSYTNSPAFARPGFKVVRDFADRTGRKFGLAEAGLLAQHVSAPNFLAMLQLWLDADVGADLTHVWCAWLLDKSSPPGTIGLLDADGNVRAEYMDVWRTVTGRKAIP